MDSDVNSDETAAEQSEKKLGKKAKVAIAAVVVVVVAALGVYLVQQQQQNDFENAVHDQVLKAVEKEYNGQTELFAQNDYVKPSKYSVDSLEVSKINETDGKVTGKATADVSNDSFSTEVKLKFSADVDGSRNVLNASFEPAKTKTTPNDGISMDEEHGIEEVDSDNSYLSDDGGAWTCSVSYVDNSNASWVVKSGLEHTLTYTFDGTKWNFKEDKTGGGDTEWGDFVGTYYANDGSDSWLRMYSNTPGEVVCEWHGDYTIPGSAGDVVQDLGGTVSATCGDLEMQDYGNGFYGFDFSDEGGYGANGLGAKVHFKLVFNPEQEGSLRLFKSDYQEQATEKYRQYIAIVEYRHGSSVKNLHKLQAGVIGVPDSFTGGQSSFNDTGFSYTRKSE